MAAKKPARSSKSRPRTVRLTHSDEKWVDEQEHPNGFSGVIADAVRFYRQHRDDARRKLLESF